MVFSCGKLVSREAECWWGLATVGPSGHSTGLAGCGSLGVGLCVEQGAVL